MCRWFPSLSPRWPPGVASGKLKILAVCSSDRSEFNPDVPTLQELGYDVDVTAWGGFGVAKGTPDDVKEVLYAAFEKAVNSEEFKELASQGQYSPLIMDHEEFAEFAQSPVRVLHRVLHRHCAVNAAPISVARIL